MIIDFTNSKDWIDKFKEYRSSKRPIVRVPDNFKTTANISKQFPVPWQSAPFFGKRGKVFDIIEDNEKIVVQNNLCGYCGIEIKLGENVCRWTHMDSKPSHNGVRVFSDHFPMHNQCMNQARIFCPHMKDRPEKEFEYGIFEILKNNMINDLKRFDQ